MLKIENLLITLGDTKVEIPNMIVEKGDYVAIMGTTGAGKTVLAEAIVGFHVPTRGKVYLNGKDILSIPINKRGIAIVYQDYMLFPHMSVLENIQYPLKMTKKSGELKKIVELLEIESLLNRHPNTLSGGEMQRVALARALVTEPEVIIMDEPFSSLDRRTRTKVRRIVKEALNALGATVIHITHDIETAMLMANKLGVMHDGKMVQFGDISEIINNPKTEFVAEFMEMNILHGKVDGTRDSLTVIDVNGTKIYSSSSGEGEVMVAIKPESIIISKNRIESSMRNMLQGKIDKIVRHGNVEHVHLSFPSFKLLSILTPNAIEALSLKTGTEVYVYFKASAVRIIQ